MRSRLGPNPVTLAHTCSDDWSSSTHRTLDCANADFRFAIFPCFPVLGPMINSRRLIDIGLRARVSSRRCGTWVGSRISFLALSRDSEDTRSNLIRGKDRTSLEANTMLSDNENPGAEHSAGQFATAATTAHENTNTSEPTETVKTSRGGRSRFGAVAGRVCVRSCRDHF